MELHGQHFCKFYKDVTERTWLPIRQPWRTLQQAPGAKRSHLLSALWIPKRDRGRLQLPIPARLGVGYVPTPAPVLQIIRLACRRNLASTGVRRSRIQAAEEKVRKARLQWYRTMSKEQLREDFEWAFIKA